MDNKSPFRYSPPERLARRARRMVDPVPRSPWTEGEVDDICAVNLVPPERLVSFFSNCVERLQELKGTKIGDYLEFGVFNGNSIGSMHAAREKMGVKDMRLFGFDAFQGLPPGSENEDGGVWKPGFYECSFADTQRCLQRRGIAADDIHWVEGWYDETLSSDMAKEFNLNNIGIAFIDCDTYSSSKTVLDFLAPRIQSPIIICLDDWKLNDVDINNDGEYRAFNEFLEENPNLKAKRIPSYNRKSESFLVTRRSWQHVPSTEPVIAPE